jgi:hypothetical protein
MRGASADFAETVEIAEQEANRSTVPVELAKEASGAVCGLASYDLESLARIRARPAVATSAALGNSGMAEPLRPTSSDMASWMIGCSS